MGTDRYHRQILLLGEEGQRKIQAARVGIVGLGGLGSQLAQSLAYQGVESFVLVDDDRVDETSLNRLIGAFPSDAEAKMLKVDAAARLIHQVNPGANVRAIPCNLRTHEALDALTTCPIIFGCVDNDGARLILTELVAAYNATLIDCASEINRENATDECIGGRVILARAGECCLLCANGIDLEVAKQELATPVAREVRSAHGYGLGVQNQAASMAPLNGVIANLAAMEFLFLVTGISKHHRHLTYYAIRGKVNEREVQQRDDCCICSSLAGLRDRADVFRYALA